MKNPPLTPFFRKLTFTLIWASVICFGFYQCAPK